MIYRGKSWARIVALILTLVATILALIPVDEPTPPSRIEKAIDLAGFLFDFAALYLLFTKPGSLWFRRD